MARKKFGLNYALEFLEIDEDYFLELLEDSGLNCYVNDVFWGECRIIPYSLIPQIRRNEIFIKHGKVFFDLKGKKITVKFVYGKSEMEERVALREIYCKRRELEHIKKTLPEVEKQDGLETELSNEWDFRLPEIMELNVS